MDPYAHFEVFPGADEQHYWRLKSIDGEVVAQSEGYANEASAKRGCHAVIDAATAINLQTPPHMKIAVLGSAEESVELGERASGTVAGAGAMPSQPPGPGEPGGPPADVPPPESTEGAPAGKVDTGNPATPPASAEEVEDSEAASDEAEATKDALSEGY